MSGELTEAERKLVEARCFTCEGMGAHTEDIDEDTRNWVTCNTCSGTRLAHPQLSETCPGGHTRTVYSIGSHVSREATCQQAGCTGRIPKSHAERLEAMLQLVLSWFKNSYGSVKMTVTCHHYGADDIFYIELLKGDAGRYSWIATGEGTTLLAALALAIVKAKEAAK